MTTLTPSRLRAMIEAAGKATPGPWYAMPSVPEDGFECYFLRSDNEFLSHLDGPQLSPQADNAAHIAACDPQTIIALCRIAIAAAEYVEAFGNNDPLVEPYTELRDALREAAMYAHYADRPLGPVQISDDFLVNTWRNLHGAPYVPEMYQTVVAFGRAVLAAGGK